MKKKAIAILLVLSVFTIIPGCSSSVSDTPTDVASEKQSLVSQTESAELTSTQSSDSQSTEETQPSSVAATVSVVPKTEKNTNTKTESKTTKPVASASSKNQNKVPLSGKETTSKEDQFLEIKHDIETIEKLAVKYINEYRVAEGKPAATFLYGKAYQYAKLRSEQLVTDFSHDTGNIRAVAEKLKFGEYIELDYSSWDPKAIEELKAEGLWNPDEYSYWQPPGTEACGISTQNWDYYTDDTIARRIAKNYHDSPGHWRYVGHKSNVYFSLGITVNQGVVYDCLFVADTNPT